MGMGVCVCDVCICDVCTYVYVHVYVCCTVCECGSPVLKLKIIPLHISVASPRVKRSITELLQRVGLICA